MNKTVTIVLLVMPWSAGIAGSSPAAMAREDFSPTHQQQQLPLAMHSAMKELPRISVGRKNADLVGTDNRVLQAVVDYIAGLGGRCRRDRRGRVPHAGFTPPTLQRYRPGAERKDDPPQGGWGGPFAIPGPKGPKHKRSES